ncbi:MAG: hypothetical protein K2X00_13640, partial [Nitrospiraceae bacterium]|nr:hypothetical protein [Nitrospiraceae bacterium]
SSITTDLTNPRAQPWQPHQSLQQSQTDLRGQGPRRSVGSPRNLVEGASDGAISDRIDEGGQSLGQRYETNVTRSGQRRQDFQQDRKGEGGADDRFNQRFYDKDQR